MADRATLPPNVLPNSHNTLLEEEVLYSLEERVTVHCPPSSPTFIWLPVPVIDAFLIYIKKWTFYSYQTLWQRDSLNQPGLSVATI